MKDGRTSLSCCTIWTKRLGITMAMSPGSHLDPRYLCQAPCMRPPKVSISLPQGYTVLTSGASPSGQHLGSWTTSHSGSVAPLTIQSKVSHEHRAVSDVPHTEALDPRCLLNNLEVHDQWNVRCRCNKVRSPQRLPHSICRPSNFLFSLRWR